jgi:hypothetical protein
MHPYQSDVLARGQIDRLHREAALHRLATSANGRGGKAAAQPSGRASSARRHIRNLQAIGKEVPGGNHRLARRRCFRLGGFGVGSGQSRWQRLGLARAPLTRGITRPAAMLAEGGFMLSTEAE